MPLDKNDRARVTPKIVEGEITGKRFDPDTGEKFLQLTWDTEDGTHDRWFPADELEAVPSDEAPAEE